MPETHADPGSPDCVDTVEWIAVDRGSSTLRAWAMRGVGALAEASIASGASGLAADAFEPALLGVVARWLPPDRRTTSAAWLAPAAP